MHIRPAEPRDLIEIIEMGSKAFSYIKKPEEFFLRRLKEGHVYVAVDGEVLGFVDFDVEGNEMKIQGIVVREKYRGLGIGKTLLRWALDRGREMKMKRAVLFTLKSNGPARRLYEGLGFRIMKEEGDFVWYERPLGSYR